MAQREAREFDNFTGGVNLRDAPVSLGRNDLILSENMEPIAGGWLQGRGGQTNYNASQIDANPIRSLHRFYRSTGSGILIATSGTKVYKGGDGAGTFASIDTGYTSDKKFSMVTWSVKNKAYWTNGIEVLKSYDGTTVATVGGTPPVFPYIEYHQNRLWMLKDNTVRFSNLNVDNVWPGANALNVSDSKGGVGTFIKSLGQPLIIGKDTGLHRFLGSPLLGGELVPYSDIPCIAAWTADVFTFPDDANRKGIIFLGPDGVYITDGFQTRRIAGKIRPLFTSFFRTAVGKYYPKKKQYVLSFSTSGGTNDQLWIGTRLETPLGEVISWHKHLNFKAESFATWDGAGDVGEIYYGRGDGGTVRRMDTGKQDVGSDYTCRFQVHNEDFGDSKLNKQPRWIKAVFESSRPISYSVDYDIGKQASAGELQRELTTNVMTWDTDNWDEKNWAGPLVSNKKTSILSFKSGRYLSFLFQNSGDGPNFRFYGFNVEARIKDGRVFEVFSLANEA